MVANNIINNKEKEKMKNHSLSHNVWAFFQDRLYTILYTTRYTSIIYFKIFTSPFYTRDHFSAQFWHSLLMSHLGVSQIPYFFLARSHATHSPNPFMPVRMLSHT